MSGIFRTALSSTRPCSPQPMSPILIGSWPLAARATYGAAAIARPSLAPAERKSRRVVIESNLYRSNSVSIEFIAPQRKAIVTHEEQRCGDERDMHADPGHALAFL